MQRPASTGRHRARAICTFAALCSCLAGVGVWSAERAPVDLAGRATLPLHWQLKVLQPAATLVFDVPLTGRAPYDRVRGDVRGDRIVLLLTGNSNRPYRRGHLYVAELPRIGAPGAVTEGGQR